MKNRLIYLSTLYEEYEIKEEEQESLRNEINEAWKEVYKQLGRNKNKKLDDDEFLMAHWIIYYRYTRQKGSDYIRFLLDDQFTPQNIFTKTEVKTSTLEKVEELHDETEPEESDEIESVVKRSKLRPKEIQNYVNSLKTASGHWYNTFNPLNNQDLNKKEILWIDRMNRIGMVYFRPLITASFMNPKVTSGDRIKLFKEIERFIFIIFRMGRAYSTYRNSEFYRAARQLNKDEITIDEIISNLKERMSWSFYKGEDEKKYFDLGHFQKYLQKKFNNGGGFYNWNGLRYFLYEYEMEKVRQRGSQKIDWNPFVKSEKDKVSIEHIYPQTADEPCWEQYFSGYNDEQLNYLTNTLGNLLPLSMSINSSLQNDCFKNKKSPKFNDDGDKLREGYNNGSHSEIEVSSYENWTPETIKERGVKLLKFMEVRWEIEFENEQKMLELLFLSQI